MKKKLMLVVAAAISCPLLGYAEDAHDQSMRARMGEIKEELQFHKSIDGAASVYSTIAKGSHGEVPARVLQNARCIAVLPNVITGALVVGGTHGKGLASCKDKNSKWSQPAPISLNQASIGLQAGAKATDLVLFFQNNEGVRALKQGNFTFGANASAIAGNYDSSVDTSNAGVVVYSRTEGAFAGASVNGGTIKKDQDALKGYYGKNVEYVSLLEGKESAYDSEYAKKLLNQFP